MQFYDAVELQKEANCLIEATFAKKQSLDSQENKSLVIPFLNTGIHIKGKKDYQLALHLETEDLLEIFEPLKDKAHGEINIKITGSVYKQSFFQKYHRPLRIGASVSHYLGDTGTLGCFVRKRRSIKQKIIDFFLSSKESELLILSNNHVLANENNAEIGDPIIQPGCLDSGDIQKHQIGTLQKFIPLEENKKNLVDAAVAKVDKNIVKDLSLLDDRLRIKGIHKIYKGIQPQQIIEDKICVVKFGRTTERTEGKITGIMGGGRYQFGPINYGTEEQARYYYFDTVIAIEGNEGQTFSQRGDSGSIIVDEKGYVLALLFAGSTKGITYAIPINTVLKELDLELVYG